MAEAGQLTPLKEGHQRHVTLWIKQSRPFIHLSYNHHPRLYEIPSDRKFPLQLSCMKQFKSVRASCAQGNPFMHTALPCIEPAVMSKKQTCLHTSNIPLIRIRRGIYLSKFCEFETSWYGLCVLGFWDFLD
jgi:hypothetical protein